MLILDGIKLNREIASELSEAISDYGQNPKLLIIQVGENDASDIYIQKKIEFGYNVGAHMTLKKFREDTPEEEIINFIKEKNEDSEVNGILVQLPLPKHINRRNVLDSVSIEKDVDGISSENLKRLDTDEYHYIPVPVKGIITILDKNNIEVKGKKVVIINDTNLVGKPAEKIFSNRGADVIICNDQTENLAEVTKTADILITAIGQPEMISEKYLSEGQVVIDVGISQTEDGVKGDVKQSLSSEDSDFKLKAITPVPGGIGPMTVASLFQNLVQAYEMQQN